MLNFRSGPYQVWFPGKQLWELWVVDSQKKARLVDTCEDSRLLKFRRREKTRILALPTSQNIALPFVTSAYNEKRLIAGAQNCLKQENIRCDLEGTGAQPIAGLPPRTLARIDVPKVDQRVCEFAEDLDPTMIVPAASLLPLPVNSIALWEELRKPVMGFERNGLTVYYSDFEGTTDIEYGQELSKKISHLKTTGIIENTTDLYLWGHFNAKIFRKAISIPVVRSFRTDPLNLQSCVGVMPKHYRETEQEKIQVKGKRSKQLFLGLAASVFFLLIATIFTLSAIQTKQQRARVAELKAEAVRIGKLKQQWEEVAPALDRNESVLEVWRKVINLPSSNAIYVDRLSIGKKGVELSCQASNSNDALKFIDDVGKHTSLAMFSWDYQTMEVLRDGTALFELKGLK